MRRVVGLLWRIDRRLTATAIAGSFLEAASYGLVIVLMERLVRSLVSASWSPITVGLLIGVFAAQQALSATAQTAEAVLSQKSTAEINCRLLSRLHCLPYSAFENSEFQGHQGMIVREGSRRPAALVQSLIASASAFVTVASVLAGLVSIGGPSVFLLVLLVVPFLLVEWRFAIKVVDLQTSSSPDLLRMQYLAQLSVDPLWQRDVRAYDSDVLPVEYRRIAQRYLALLRSLVWRFEAVRLVVGVAGALGAGAVVLLTINLVRSNSLTPSEATTLIVGLYASVSQVRLLAHSFGESFESLEYGRLMFEFLDFRPPEVSPPKWVPGDPVRIVAGGLNYRYPDVDRPALDEVSFVLRPGITAVIGPNGAGKSTLVKVFAGLVAPTSGMIEGVGIDPSRRGVLFQDTSHMRLTVRQNVTMRAIPGEVDQEVGAALAKAGLQGVVEDLPHGLDTLVGIGFGGAVDLSGGQWQRLALARLYYHDADLVILDEPATSLDAAGERDLMDALLGIGRTRIVVVVTHRLETVRRADHVLALDDGRLTFDGSVDELLQSDQVYLS